jgi:hypothetical protein
LSLIAEIRLNFLLKQVRFRSLSTQAGVDGREDLTNQRAHDGHSGDDDDSNQYQDQRVLNHALSFFLESEFHNILISFSYKMGYVK